MRTHLSDPHFLQIRERRLAYRIAGRTDGLPVVLVHALAGQSETWDKTAGALVELGFFVIAPDLRGHGRSDWPKSYALAGFERDLVALLDALHLGRVDLIGHSLGAHLALRIAACAPDRVGRVVIESTPVPPRDEADAANMRAQGKVPRWSRALRTLGTGRMLRLALLRRFDFRAVAPVLRELRSPMSPWWRGVDAIQAPCLLLASKNDGAITERIGLLSSCLANSRTVFLGTGHRLHAEHLDAFLGAVSPFLAAGLPPLATCDQPREPAIASVAGD